MNKRELRKALPPGPRMPRALQIIGFWKRPSASIERLRRRYGKRFTVALPFQPPFVILSDPDEIKQLFTAPPDVLHPGEGAGILEPIVGRNSVILLDEKPHLEQRKLLLPAFHGEKMQRLTGLMAELTDREVESWPVGEPVTLHPRLQRLTLEIILRTVFGLEQGQRLDSLRDMLTEVLAFSESPLSVMPALQRFAGWWGPLKRFNELITQTDALIFDLIAERRTGEPEHAGAEPENAGAGPEHAGAQSERDDILTMLLSARHEDGSQMSDQEIRDELMTALVAGHETTASQLAWGFERLARERDISRRLQQELDGGNGEEYLTATIHEILRLRPVLPNAEPRLVKRPVRIGDWEYPPGVALLASAYLVHHDPDIYEEPYAFRPERFIDAQPGTYTWLPFGGGRRRCLGASFALQEMRIVLRSVISRYEISPATAEPERTARRSITFSPDRGATVILRPRIDARAAADADPALPAAA